MAYVTVILATLSMLVGVCKISINEKPLDEGKMLLIQWLLLALAIASIFLWKQ